MDRCSTCPATHKCLQGDGSLDSKVWIVGERPGQQEERMGRVFIGDSGAELDRLYLRLAGLGRDDCYVTNVVKCGSERNKKPTDKEIEGCASFHLTRELEQGCPSLVVLMGASACSLVEGLALDVQHGIPFKASLFGWSGWVVGMYHPAAGMHQTALMIPLIDDWKRLGQWLELEPVEHDRPTETDFHLATRWAEVDSYFVNSMTCLQPQPDTTPLAGVDTESHDGQPFSIQASVMIGTGIMVRVENKPCMKVLGHWLNQFELVLHNAPADLWIEKALGLRSLVYRDTMQEAYHFQNLPQGLKALVYRLLHKRRQSWDEVVGPPSKAKLQEWLLNALTTSEGERLVLPRLGKRGQEIQPEIVKSPFERTLKGILSHLAKSETYDPWDRVTAEMEDRFGRAPRKGVRWVEQEDLINYACQDASDCLELALLFDVMRREIVEREWSIMEEDWDAVQVPEAERVV